MSKASEITKKTFRQQHFQTTRSNGLTVHSVIYCSMNTDAIPRKFTKFNWMLKLWERISFPMLWNCFVHRDRQIWSTWFSAFICKFQAPSKRVHVGTTIFFLDNVGERVLQCARPIVCCTMLNENLSKVKPDPIFSNISQYITQHSVQTSTTCCIQQCWMNYIFT
jgi:hypothetical protein